MKTVVITGATSFIGAHLCLAFDAAGWRVVAARSKPDAAYSGIQAERLSVLPKDMTAAVFDITDARAVADTAQRFAPDLWIQHAGYATNHAGADFDLARGLMINAGSIPPLFSALAGSTCGVIVTGTEAEYPAGDTLRREDMTGTPRSPYGLSKLAATMAAEQYAQMTGVAARVARIFLPFGALDNPGKLFPASVAALAQGRPIKLSACDQIRDILGSADVCAAYLAIAADLGRGGYDVFNVSRGEAGSLRSTIEALANLMGADKALLRFGMLAQRPGEPMRIVGANTKARSVLGWEPRPLATALASDLDIQAPAGTRY